MNDLRVQTLSKEIESIVKVLSQPQEKKEKEDSTDPQHPQSEVVNRLDDLRSELSEELGYRVKTLKSIYEFALQLTLFTEILLLRDSKSSDRKSLWDSFLALKERSIRDADRMKTEIEELHRYTILKRCGRKVDDMEVLTDRVLLDIMLLRELQKRENLKRCFWELQHAQHEMSKIDKNLFSSLHDQVGKLKDRVSTHERHMEIGQQMKLLRKEAYSYHLQHVSSSSTKLFEKKFPQTPTYVYFELDDIFSLMKRHGKNVTKLALSVYCRFIFEEMLKYAGCQQTITTKLFSSAKKKKKKKKKKTEQLSKVGLRIFLEEAFRKKQTVKMRFVRACDALRFCVSVTRKLMGCDLSERLEEELPRSIVTSGLFQRLERVEGIFSVFCDEKRSSKYVTKKNSEVVWLFHGLRLRFAVVLGKCDGTDGKRDREDGERESTKKKRERERAVDLSGRVLLDCVTMGGGIVCGEEVLRMSYPVDKVKNKKKKKKEKKRKRKKGKKKEKESEVKSEKKGWEEDRSLYVEELGKWKGIAEGHSNEKENVYLVLPTEVKNRKLFIKFDREELVLEGKKWIIGKFFCELEKTKFVGQEEDAQMDMLVSMLKDKEKIKNKKGKRLKIVMKRRGRTQTKRIMRGKIVDSRKRIMKVGVKKKKESESEKNDPFSRGLQKLLRIFTKQGGKTQRKIYHNYKKEKGQVEREENSIIIKQLANSELRSMFRKIELLRKQIENDGRSEISKMLRKVDEKKEEEMKKLLALAKFKKKAMEMRCAQLERANSKLSRKVGKILKEEKLLKLRIEKQNERQKGVKKIKFKRKKKKIEKKRLMPPGMKTSTTSSISSRECHNRRNRTIKKTESELSRTTSSEVFLTELMPGAVMPELEDQIPPKRKRKRRRKKKIPDDSTVVCIIRILGETKATRILKRLDVMTPFLSSDEFKGRLVRIIEKEHGGEIHGFLADSMYMSFQSQNVKECPNFVENNDVVVGACVCSLKISRVFQRRTFCQYHSNSLFQRIRIITFLTAVPKSEIDRCVSLKRRFRGNDHLAPLIFKMCKKMDHYSHRKFLVKEKDEEDDPPNIFEKKKNDKKMLRRQRQRQRKKDVEPIDIGSEIVMEDSVVTEEVESMFQLEQMNRTMIRGKATKLYKIVL